MSSHKDLIVWKRSITFVTEIYKITESFPAKEMYGLTSQIRRASVSIPSNIAEGACRKSTADYIHFLYYSYASAAEVNTQLIISHKLNYLKTEEFQVLEEELTQISKMINAMIKKLEQKSSNS